MNTRPPAPLRNALREIRGGYLSLTGQSVDFAPQPLGCHIDPNGLGGYYCDLRHKATDPTMEIDGPAGPTDPAYMWVIPIAQAALGFWDLRIEGEEVDDDFLKLADWLLDKSEPGAGGVIWRNDFPVAKYGLQVGWTSAMGQGQAISVLLRAHLLTGRSAYLDAARGAMGSLSTPVSSGGTQSSIDGYPVLEEYPTPTPSAVLNGWIFSLFGVHELAVATDDRGARDLFERSVAGLLEILPRYDNGWWTLYSLYDHGQRDLAKPFYQRLHPVLLEGLALIHPSPRLDAYAKRWRDQHTFPALTRVSFNKILFRAQRALR